MKALLLITLFSSITFANECKEVSKRIVQEVVHTVNTDVPKHLQGATITITKADGTSSTVPAEKFMVVPRKQKTIVGENVAVTVDRTCQAEEQLNTLFLDVKKLPSKIESSIESLPNGTKATSTIHKDVVPGLNYYRRKMLETPVGAGVGLDANGTLKGMIGMDF